MSDDPEDDTPVTSAEPIDADFEPAFDEAGDAPRKGADGSGPGWLGVAVAAVIAAGIGGAIGIIATMAIPDKGDSGDVAALIAELDALKAGQEAADLERNKVIRDAADMESRLNTGLDSAASGSPVLSSLQDELDALSRRLDATLAADSGDAVATLSTRLDALEAVDTSGEATAAELARALGALSERVTALETRLASLQSDMLSSSGDTTELTSLIERM
jgi:hypothetical protein